MFIRVSHIRNNKDTFTYLDNNIETSNKMLYNQSQNSPCITNDCKLPEITGRQTIKSHRTKSTTAGNKNNKNNNSNINNLYKYQYKLQYVQLDDTNSLPITTTLIMLELSNCNLIDISRISECINLRYLNLSYNKISNINNSANQLKSLEFIILFNNCIKSTDDINCLSDIRTIKYLNLMNNQINNIYNYRQVIILLLLNTTIIGLDDYIIHESERAVSYPTLTKLLNQDYRRLTTLAIKPYIYKRFELISAMYEYKQLYIPTSSVIASLLSRRIEIMKRQYQSINPSYVIVRSIRKYVRKLNYYKMIPTVNKLIPIVKRFLQRKRIKDDIRLICKDRKMKQPLYLYLDKYHYQGSINLKYIYLYPNKPIDMMSYINMNYYVETIQKYYKKYKENSYKIRNKNIITKFIYNEYLNRKNFKLLYKDSFSNGFIILNGHIDIMKFIINRLKSKLSIYQDEFSKISFKLYSKAYVNNHTFRRIANNHKDIKNVFLSIIRNNDIVDSDNHSLDNQFYRSIRTLKVLKRRGCKLTIDDRIHIKYLTENSITYSIKPNLILISNISNLSVYYHMYEAIKLLGMPFYTEKFVHYNIIATIIQSLYRGYKLRCCTNKFLLNRLCIYRSTITIQRYWKSFYYYKRRSHLLSLLYQSIKVIDEPCLYLDAWLYYRLCQFQILPYVSNTICAYVNEFNYIPYYNEPLNKFELTRQLNYPFEQENVSEDDSTISDNLITYRKSLPHWLTNLMTTSLTKSSDRHDYEYVIYSLLTNNVDISLVNVIPNIPFELERTLDFDISTVILRIVKLTFSNVNEAVNRFIMILLCTYDYKSWLGICLLTKKQLYNQLDLHSINIINKYKVIYNNINNQRTVVDTLNKIKSLPYRTVSSKSKREKTNNLLENLLDANISLCNDELTWLSTLFSQYSPNDIIRYEFLCEALSLLNSNSKSNKHRNIWDIKRVLHWISRKEDIDQMNTLTKSEEVALSHMNQLREEQKYNNNVENNHLNDSLEQSNDILKTKQLVKLLDTIPLTQFSGKLNKISDSSNNEVDVSTKTKVKLSKNNSNSQANNIPTEYYLNELEKTLEKRVLVNNILKAKQDLHNNYINKKLKYRNDIILKNKLDKEIFEKQLEINEINLSNRINHLTDNIKQHKLNKDISNNNRMFSLTSSVELISNAMKTNKMHQKSDEIIRNNNELNQLNTYIDPKRTSVSTKPMKLDLNSNSNISPKISYSRRGFSRFVLDEPLSSSIVTDNKKTIVKPPIPPNIMKSLSFKQSHRNNNFKLVSNLSTSSSFKRSDKTGSESSLHDKVIHKPLHIIINSVDNNVSDDEVNVDINMSPLVRSSSHLIDSSNTSDSDNSSTSEDKLDTSEKKTEISDNESNNSDDDGSRSNIEISDNKSDISDNEN